MRRVFDCASDWAAPFGFHPISRATSSTLARVASDTPGLPLSAYETALLDTPEAFATSKIVTFDFCATMLRSSSSTPGRMVGLFMFRRLNTRLLN